MNKRSMALLVIILFGSIPFPIRLAQAEETIRHPLDDAITLMYISDALLLDVDFPEEVFHSPGLLSPNWDDPTLDPDNALLAAALHAAKALRNDLEANCRLMVAQRRQQGKDCEADKIQSFCNQKKQEINAEIGMLHNKRGDRRRSLTKAYHWFKRQGRGFWHKIGPVGRRFLRQLGPELLQVVASGGTLSTGVVKNLFKHTAKSLVRERIKQGVRQGMQRLLQGQIEIALAAGVDICDSTESEVESSTASGEEKVSQDDVLPYALTTEEINFWWNSMFEPEEEFHVCYENWPAGNDFNPIEFQLTIDPQKETIQAELEGSREIETTHEGALWNQINQNFIVVLDGPYQLTEEVDELVLYFEGSGNLTITQSGKVYCHYWEIPSSGDPVLIEYWVLGNETKTSTSEYLMIVYTDDQITGTLQLFIGGGNTTWGESTGFLLETSDYELSTDELNKFFNID